MGFVAVFFYMREIGIRFNDMLHNLISYISTDGSDHTRQGHEKEERRRAKMVTFLGPVGIKGLWLVAKYKRSLQRAPCITLPAA
jgi:hypothetical protein